MSETINVFERTEPQVRSLFKDYLNRAPVIEHKYTNYLRQKKIDDADTRAILALGVTGSLSTTPSSKNEEKQRREWIVKQRLENSFVDDFEYYRSPVLKPISNQNNLSGPYTVNGNPNREVETEVNGITKKIRISLIEKIFYNEKPDEKPIPIYFGIAHAAQNNQDYLVVYSTYLDKNKQRIRIVYSMNEKIYKHQNNTAYLKRRARQTLLHLLEQNHRVHRTKTDGVLQIGIPVIEVREAA